MKLIVLLFNVDKTLCITRQSLQMESHYKFIKCTNVSILQSREVVTIRKHQLRIENLELERMIVRNQSNGVQRSSYQGVINRCMGISEYERWKSTTFWIWHLREREKIPHLLL